MIQFRSFVRFIFAEKALQDMVFEMGCTLRGNPCRFDDGRLAVLHIVLGNFALVGFHFFCKKSTVNGYVCQSFLGFSTPMRFSNLPFYERASGGRYAPHLPGAYAGLCKMPTHSLLQNEFLIVCTATGILKKILFIFCRVSRRYRGGLL